MRIKCNPDGCHMEDESSDMSSEVAASFVDYQTLGISRMRNANISTEILGDLESELSNFKSVSEIKTCKITSEKFTNKHFSLSDKMLDSKASKSGSLEFLEKCDIQMVERKTSLDSSHLLRQDTFLSKSIQEIDQIDGNLVGGNIILEVHDKTANEITFLPSNEDFTVFSSDNSDDETIKNTQKAKQKQIYPDDKINKENYLNVKPYALATLDGTIMLVKDEIILWLIAKYTNELLRFILESNEK